MPRPLIITASDVEEFIERLAAARGWGRDEALAFILKHGVGRLLASTKHEQKRRAAKAAAR